MNYFSKALIQSKIESESVNTLVSLPLETKQLLIADGIISLKQYLKLDPFQISMDYGIDVQTAFLSLREASILMRQSLPVIAPFPKNPILVNASFVKDQLWLVGIDTGMKIIHWVSYTTPSRERILLLKLNKTLKILDPSNTRPLIFLSENEHALKDLSMKSEKYSMEFLYTAITQRSLTMNEFLKENLLWNGSINLWHLANWLDISPDYPVLEMNEIESIVEKDFRIYGSTRQKKI